MLAVQGTRDESIAGRSCIPVLRQHDAHLHAYLWPASTAVTLHYTTTQAAAASGFAATPELNQVCTVAVRMLQQGATSLPQRLDPLTGLQALSTAAAVAAAAAAAAVNLHGSAETTCKQTCLKTIHRSACT